MDASSLEFAVTDFETTGLRPERNDRVVELAVVRINSKGQILKEFTTLVNPGRDLGPVSIHGLTGDMVRNAPTFEDIAGHVISHIAGAVFVAHNAVFDIRFLQAELRRIEYRHPELPYLCTMRLATQVDPMVPSRALVGLCAHFGIRYTRAHSAYDDAGAAARLLACCALRQPALLAALIENVPQPASAWLPLQVHADSYPRSRARAEQNREPSLLATVVARLPATTDLDPAIGEYLSILDRVLEDRTVTEAEVDLLQSVAVDLKLSQEQTLLAHRRYLQDLITVALADEVLSEIERDDLRKVRRLLGFTVADVREMISRAQTEQPATKAVLRPAPDLVGKLVCFTGELQCTLKGVPIDRSMAENLVSERGLVVKPGVSKKLDFLVAADPNSLSTKARTARKLGVRIIAEQAFWRMIGLMPD